jgi:hypothetical protein
LTTLDDWSEAFRRLDRSCPWPGPRTLDWDRPEDRQLLVGRKDDEDAFSDDVLAHQLVILTADSGVGKSSLLEIGLTRRLEADGFVPLVCRTWAKFEDGDSVEQFLVRNLKKELPAGVVFDGTSSLCGQLDRRYGERAVLVLDQFEELIRYRPQISQDVLAWLATVNQRHETHVVLSLRSEYTHRLRWLEGRVRPFSLATYVLEPLAKADNVEDVIRSGNRTSPGAITEPAVDLLTETWLETTADAAGGADNVGLLHLQATLYALHARTEGSIEVPNVQAMLNDAIVLGKPLYEVAAQETVRLKLELCRNACRHPSLPEPLDPVLIEGTMGMVQRVSGQLSSGGYKLVREEWELASKTLTREIERLGRHGGEDAEMLYRRLTEPGDEHRGLLSRRGEDIDPFAAAGPHSPGALEAIGISAAPWTADPDDLSSGPMFGMAPRAILVEELRRFAFALQWLRVATIVRASSPTAGQTMLSLVHDGFGAALDAWAIEHRAGPGRAIHLLTAAHGERFDWQSDRSDVPSHPELDGGEGVVTITNVRWRDCIVSASFRRVVFVNCDFRGTRFEQCGFRGVTFVNCLLDGATFGECTIYGKVRDAAEVQATLPDFKVAVPADTVAAITRYRGLQVPRIVKDERAALYSKTSGLPAVPWSLAMGEGVPWTEQIAGMAMYGGRLSALMIRACVFQDMGMLALRHIAGSSLDVVEQQGGDFDIFDSAIRGLTVTRRVEEADPDARGTTLTPDLNINVRASLVANTWFGPALNGRASFNDCVVWQLVNLSDRQVFDVQLESCGYVGLANVRLPGDGSGARTEFQIDAINDRDNVARLALRMDYRSTPARLELDSDESTGPTKQQF